MSFKEQENLQNEYNNVIKEIEELEEKKRIIIKKINQQNGFIINNEVNFKYKENNDLNKEKALSINILFDDANRLEGNLFLSIETFNIFKYLLFIMNDILNEKEYIIDEMKIKNSKICLECLDYLNLIDEKNTILEDLNKKNIFKQFLKELIILVILKEPFVDDFIVNHEFDFTNNLFLNKKNLNIKNNSILINFEGNNSNIDKESFIELKDLEVSYKYNKLSYEKD